MQTYPPFSSHLNLLYDQETYATRTSRQKILNLFITLCPFVHWISLFFYLLINLRSLPIETVGEEFALSIGGLLVAYRLLVFNKNRRELSEIVDELNTWNLNLRRYRADFNHLSDRIQYWQMKIGSFMTIMGGGIGVPQAVFALYSGRLYYNHFFPVDTSDYSWAFFAVWIFQFFTVCSCTICSCLQECILTDWYIQLSFNYYTLNQRALELRRAPVNDRVDESKEMDKLLDIIRTYQEMEQIAKRLSKFVNTYLTLIFSLFYVAVSISVFVLISVANQGYVFVIKSLLYPIFTSGVMVLWCSIGQNLLDQVRGKCMSFNIC